MMRRLFEDAGCGGSCGGGRKTNGWSWVVVSEVVLIERLDTFYLFSRAASGAVRLHFSNDALKSSPISSAAVA